MKSRSSYTIDNSTKLNIHIYMTNSTDSSLTLKTHNAISAYHHGTNVVSSNPVHRKGSLFNIM